MIQETVQRWRCRAESYFPERHIYIRSDGAMHGLVVTSSHQLYAASAAAALALWLLLGTGAMLGDVLGAGRGDQDAVRLRARYERLLADRESLVWRHVAVARGLLVRNPVKLADMPRSRPA